MTPHRHTSAAQPDSHPQPHLSETAAQGLLLFFTPTGSNWLPVPTVCELREPPSHGWSLGIPQKQREKLLSRAPTQQSHRQSPARRTSWEHFAEHTVIPTPSSSPRSHAADRGCGEDYHVKSNENKKYRQENYNILKGSFRIIKIIPLLCSLFLKTPNQTTLSVLNVFLFFFFFQAQGLGNAKIARLGVFI